MRLTTLVVLPILLVPASAHAQAATAGIDEILTRGALARAHWGVHAVDAASGEVLYSRNADQLFVPASNLKLVVAAAGAHYLGGGFVWRTELRAAGQVRNGELHGDLVVHGTGDPGISGRFADDGMLTVLEAWADSLHARGIRRIAGAVVADQTHWDAQLRSADWEIYDVNWWYAAPVAPLGFNDNAIDFRVAPGPPGAPARITWAPRTADFVFVNRTRTAASGSDYTLDFDRVAGTDTIFAYGELPVDASTRTEYFAVDDPGRYLATVLTEVLEARGIDVAAARGRSIYAPASAPPTTTLFVWTSPPLPTTIAPILLTSQNWFAEQLLKTIGYAVKGTGSFAAGLEAEAEFLRDVVGIDSSAFVLRDASGLSASNLITPRALTVLARYIRTSELAERLAPGISVSGESGSLRARLTDLSGRVQAKTGSIRHVASLSGTVLSDSGREIVFAIVANNTGTSGARVSAAIDDVVRALAGQ